MALHNKANLSMEVSFVRCARKSAAITSKEILIEKISPVEIAFVNLSTYRVVAFDVRLRACEMRKQQ